MTEELLVSTIGRETRLALVSDGRLRELVIEAPEAVSVVGALYWGRVKKVVPGIGAAFVDCGLARDAFLAARDAGVPGDPAPIERRVHEGEALVVQVVKDPVDEKGARVTAWPAFAGRYLVYTPRGEGLSVSRRIDDTVERDRLVGLVQRIGPPPGGLILRTAAAGAGRDALADDLARLHDRWAEIEAARQLASSDGPPARLDRPLDPVARYLERMREPPDLVVIDDPSLLAEARRACGDTVPDMRLESHGGPGPLFARHDLEAQIAAALEPNVDLPSGARLAIEQTRALCAIDVDTARFTGPSGRDDTVLRTNLEAAREIAWQLRLRDIGGVVVIDFITMDAPAHRAEVVAALRHVLADDPVAARVIGLSPIGLVELTRTRVRAPLSRRLTEACASCQGSGRVKTARAVAAEILRAAAAEARAEPGRRLSITAAPEVVAALDGEGGLAEIESLAGTTVTFTAAPDRPRESFEVAAC
jgi:ribonuclease G